MILHKRYKFCPECQSVMIRRVHRGLIQKYIFRQKPKYLCGNCQTVFLNPLLEKDIKKSQAKEGDIIFEEKPILNLEEIREINVDKKSSFKANAERYENENIQGLEKEFKREVQH